MRKYLKQYMEGGKGGRYDKYYVGSMCEGWKGVI
jgi:hypothetical protein